MRAKIVLTIWLGVMMSLSYQSCKQAADPVDTSLLEGRWLVVSAERNATDTKTLNEAFFEFSADSTLQTNFTGQEIKSSYTSKNNIILLQSEDKLTFDILKLSADSLILATKLMDYDFKLIMENERLDPFDKLDEEFDDLKRKEITTEPEDMHSKGHHVKDEES